MSDNDPVVTTNRKERLANKLRVNKSRFLKLYSEDLAEKNIEFEDPEWIENEILNPGRCEHMISKFRKCQRSV